MSQCAGVVDSAWGTNGMNVSIRWTRSFAAGSRPDTALASARIGGNSQARKGSARSMPFGQRSNNP